MIKEDILTMAHSDKIANNVENVVRVVRSKVAIEVYPSVSFRKSTICSKLIFDRYASIREVARNTKFVANKTLNTSLLLLLEMDDADVTVRRLQEMVLDASHDLGLAYLLRSEK